MNYLHSQLFLQLGFKLDSGRDSASKLLCGGLAAEELAMNQGRGAGRPLPGRRGGKEGRCSGQGRRAPFLGAGLSRKEGRGGKLETEGLPPPSSRPESNLRDARLQRLHQDRSRPQERPCLG